ncbi:hypothetical protein [Puniceibacterium confluentis]|uniref:hypothetical protein n=1 Tax=Puniceibacterium confluentis TaxID=1958944 RepID=UPI0011B68CE9|nr:hypothetical protein [Puniceibacterium confluentis]
MPSPHESAIAALLSALSGHAATVIRESDLPVDCPDAGLVNVVPEDPEDVGQHLGTGTREWERPVDLETVVRGPDAATRDAALDAALVSLAALLLADRTLGGAVDWIEVGAPQENEAVPMMGAETLKGAVLPVTLFYETTDNPME